jgi:molybdate transport system substrate-binding protein
MKKLWLTSFLFFLFPCFSFSEPLTVAVSANVRFAFNELKSVFEASTGIPVQEAVGSSGQLTTQIEHGAPFDVFLSADMDYPRALYEKGLTYNEPKIYVYGTLVLWTLADLDLTRGMDILTDPFIQKIALPAPKTSPYGRRAVNVLQHYGLYERLVPKFVYGESISQTNQFITSLACDIGFTAKSVVLAPNMKGQGTWVAVEKDAYEPIAQGAVILKYAEKGHLSSAQKFYEFLFSPVACEIYQRYGYEMP